MSIENDPFLSDALPPTPEPVVEWVNASHELEEEVDRVELLGSNAVNMSFHNLWVGNKWASILFSSRYGQDYRGPLVNLTVNYQTIEQPHTIVIEDFQALPNRGRISFQGDVRYQDGAGDWDVNNLSGPLFNLTAGKDSHRFEVLTGSDYQNCIWTQQSSPKLLLDNTPHLRQLGLYLGLLNRSTRIPKVKSIIRKNT